MACKGRAGVLPHSACSRFAGELGKVTCQTENSATTRKKKLKDQSQLLHLLPLVLPWGHFPEVRGPTLVLHGPAREGTQVSEPLAGGWALSTQVLFRVAGCNPATAEPQHPCASPSLSSTPPFSALSTGGGLVAQFAPKCWLQPAWRSCCVPHCCLLL